MCKLVIYDSVEYPSYWSTAIINVLNVIYHPLYSMNIFVTNKSKLPQDGAQVFLYMGWLAIMWPYKKVIW